ncbi:PTS system, beta-glucoside-specific IIABC subunit [Listeria fleischmannii subsp. coloradonensis]|nr:PTS system, beta-glucoside-specific IIABC subunit [Listeria fleischmannii subsp. coloradonensis]
MWRKNGHENLKPKELLETLHIESPIKGEILPLSSIKDPAFSGGLLGKGIAVKPSEGKVYAVEDATVETLFPTKHAIGLKLTNGVEILIHIGMDTVNLEGRYFDAKVKQGEHVKKGDLLVEFDLNKLVDEGYSIETPVIITNSDQYLDIISSKESHETDLNPNVILSIVK